MSNFTPRVDKTKLYMTLNVSFSADTAAIKSAYKKLAVKFHPDKHVNSSEEERLSASKKFQEIAAAFEILQDPVLREAYDKHGMPGVLSCESYGDADGYAEGSGQDKQDPFSNSFHSNRANQDPSFGGSGGGGSSSSWSHRQESEQEKAYRIYRSIFDPIPGQFDNIPIHNMASQRGSGSFEQYQKERLNDILN
jgi:DnaJ-class molecular chaperone